MVRAKQAPGQGTDQDHRASIPATGRSRPKFKRLSAVAQKISQPYGPGSRTTSNTRGTSKQMSRPSKYIRNVMAYNREAPEEDRLNEASFKQSMDDSLMQNESQLLEGSLGGPQRTSGANNTQYQ